MARKSASSVGSICVSRRRPPPAREPCPRQGTRLHIFQTAADGAARQSRRPRHSSDAAVPRRPRFRRRGQTPATLVQAGAQKLVAKTNRNLIDHSAGIAAAGPVVNPMSRQKNRRGAKQIQLFSGVALTGHFDNFFVRNNSVVRIVTI